jgi:hypothetical protein
MHETQPRCGMRGDHEFIIRRNYTDRHFASWAGDGDAALVTQVLYSTLVPENLLTAKDFAASCRALLLTSICWPVGLGLAITCFVFNTLRCELADEGKLTEQQSALSKAAFAHSRNLPPILSS